MRRALFVLTAVLGLVIVPLGSADSSYTDPAGDSRSAPDIRTVDVSNTDAGLITFRMTAGLTPDTWVRVSLAAAKNGVEVSGDAYYVGVAMNPDGSLSTFTYRVKSGPVNLGIPVEATASASAATFSFAASAFGIEDGFNFRMLSWHMATATTADSDNMPDGSGVYYYSMAKAVPPASPSPPAPAIVKPIIGRATTVPAHAVAGRRFAVSFRVTRSDTGAPLTSGKMICNPSVAGKVLRHSESFSGGTARLSFTIPKSAKGKLLRVSTTIEFGARSTSKVATFHVR